jgi:hypothetical protein
MRKIVAAANSGSHDTDLALSLGVHAAHHLPHSSRATLITGKSET